MVRCARSELPDPRNGFLAAHLAGRGDSVFVLRLYSRVSPHGALSWRPVAKLRRIGPGLSAIRPLLLVVGRRERIKLAADYAHRFGAQGCDLPGTKRACARNVHARKTEDPGPTSSPPTLVGFMLQTAPTGRPDGARQRDSGTPGRIAPSAARAMSARAEGPKRCPVREAAGPHQPRSG